MLDLVRTGEFMAGLAIVLLTWIDVVGTVVTPLRVKLGLAVGWRLRQLTHPTWTRVATRRPDERRHRLLSGFAAALLLITFVSWVLLSLLGFTLMGDAMRQGFQPAIADLTDAFATVSSAMVTLGTNNHAVRAGGGALVFAAALSGLGIVTLTLTYILQVQSGLSKRDSLVLTLPSRAGSPPSGVVLLETMAKLELTDKLALLFHDWERWCAGLLNSHCTHPVLALFRSPDPQTDWLTALGAVLDAAALAKVGLKDGPQQAQFFLSMGARTCRSLCELFNVKSAPDLVLCRADVDRAIHRLRQAGLELSADGDLAAKLNTERAAYAGHIAALADLFGVRNPPWLGPADAEELVTSEPSGAAERA